MSRVSRHAAKKSWKRTKRHSRDFSWRRSGPNPMKKVDNSASVRFRLKIGLFIFLCVSTVGCVVYHPFFRITTVKIDGLERIAEKEFRESAQSVMNYKPFFVFRGDAFVFADVDEINQVLRDKYPLTSLRVRKSFPNSLHIEVQEKISTVIYDNGKQYAYVGLDGHVVEIVRNVAPEEWTHISTTTIFINEDGEEEEKEEVIESIHRPPVDALRSEIGDYPVIFDPAGEDIVVNAPVLGEDVVSGVISWFDLLTQKSDIPFGYIVLENSQGDGLVRSREGWDILSTLDSTVPMQFDSLQFVLKEKVQRPNINYIDLRFGEKVYWQ